MYDLDTAFGAIQIEPIDSDLVVLSNAPNEPILVNGVPYALKLHLFRFRDGWRPRDVHSFFCARTDKYGDASPSARNKIMVGMVAATSVWAEMNPKALHDAGYSRVQQEEAAINAEIEELAARIDELKVRKADLVDAQRSMEKASEEWSRIERVEAPEAATEERKEEEIDMNKRTRTDR